MVPVFPAKALVLLLMLVSGTHSFLEQPQQSFPGSVRTITPQPESMTVTSFRYNPTHRLNEWFSSIFGNDSVWYNVSQKSPSWMSGLKQLGEDTMEELRVYGHKLVRERLQNIPDFAKKTPPCSIEVLAHGRLDSHPPLMRGWRDFGPVAGIGSITWTPPRAVGHAVTVKCYWRALFENWRKQNGWTSPNFWVMIFFCPLGVHESSHSPHRGGGGASESERAAASSPGGTAAASSSRRRLEQGQGQGQGQGHGQEKTHTHTSVHGGSSGRLQCLHLEKAHVGDGDGGVVGFNLSASLLTSTWTASFTGRLFPSGSPTINVLHSRHRSEGAAARHAQQQERRIHKYSSGRRLQQRADATATKSSAGAEAEAGAGAEAGAEAGAGAGAVPNIYLTEAQQQADLQSPMVAVCAIIPYTSLDKEKVLGNRQMLLEWIHYYDRLGFRVFVYDRDGANANVLHDRERIDALFGQGHQFQHLHYFNFTIRGLLDTTRAGLKYDNTERKPGAGWGASSSTNTLRARYEAQGHDKVNTFTHCRFEAKAIYGLDRVLAVDFDEFLYCPSAPPNPAVLATMKKGRGSGPGWGGGATAPSAEGALTATARDLGRYINTVTATLQEAGLRQVMIQQRVTMNVTSSARDCIVSKVSSSPPRSVLGCYGSYRYERASHSIKSFHLGTTCPLTGYHQACPYPQTPRAYDCACNNFDLDSKRKEWPYPVPGLVSQVKCVLFHLSTNRCVAPCSCPLLSPLFSLSSPLFSLFSLLSSLFSLLSSLFSPLSSLCSLDY